MANAYKWYEPDCPDVAANLAQTVDKIITQHEDRRAEDRDYLYIYNNKDIQGTGKQDARSDPWKRVRYNLFRSAVTTCRATLGSTRPAIRFGTTNADWSIMRRAQAREQAVRSVNDDNKLYDLFKEAFTDALTTTIGAIKTYSEDGKVKKERVGPGELLVDRDEGYYRQPPNLYQIKPIDRSKLRHMYPGKGLEIDSASKGQLQNAFGWLPGWDLGDDQVMVIEAWHLPLWDAKADEWTGGQHCIAVTSGLLLGLEEWKTPRFPFAVYRWEKRSFGWHGMSLCEDLCDNYKTIAYFDSKIQDLIYNLSRVKMFVKKGQKPTALTDDPLDYIETPDGTDPLKIFVPNVVPEEIISLRRETIEDAKAQIGLNDMTMTGQKPAGDWSGIALQELKDSASQRFKDKLQEIEQFYVDDAYCTVDEIERLSDAGELKQFKARVVRGTRYQVNEINWSANKLEADEYWIETNASSSLPQSTAGKLYTVQAWQQMGWIDSQQARELMNMPDLESANSTALAPYYEALDKIEDIVEDGKYTAPDSADDLENTERLALGAYNKFKRMGLDQERLDLLLQLADECGRMAQEAQAPAEVAQPGAEAMPTEQPAPESVPQGMGMGGPQIMQA